MTFRWNIIVLEYDHYGNRVVKETPMSILADTKTQVTEKVRAAFEAKLDTFRHFWSHGWRLISVAEEATSVADDARLPEKAPQGILSDA